MYCLLPRTVPSVARPICPLLISSTIRSSSRRKFLLPASTSNFSTTRLNRKAKGQGNFIWRAVRKNIQENEAKESARARREDQAIARSMRLTRAEYLDFKTGLLVRLMIWHYGVRIIAGTAVIGVGWWAWTSYKANTTGLGFEEEQVVLEQDGELA